MYAGGGRKVVTARHTTLNFATKTTTGTTATNLSFVIASPFIAGDRAIGNRRCAIVQNVSTIITAIAPLATLAITRDFYPRAITIDAIEIIHVSRTACAEFAV